MEYRFNPVRKGATAIIKCITSDWFRPLGPMKLLITDQEGALMGEECSQWLDRWSVQLKTKEPGSHSPLVEYESWKSPKKAGSSMLGSTVTSMRMYMAASFVSFKRTFQLFADITNYSVKATIARRPI